MRLLSSRSENVSLEGDVFLGLEVRGEFGQSRSVVVSSVGERVKYVLYLWSGKVNKDCPFLFGIRYPRSYKKILQ